MKAKPWIFGAVYAENGEIYSEYLSAKWTNYGFMHEKMGVKQHCLTPLN